MLSILTQDHLSGLQSANVCLQVQTHPFCSYSPSLTGLASPAFQQQPKHLEGCPSSCCCRCSWGPFIRTWHTVCVSEHVKQHLTLSVILLQVQLKVSQLVNGIEYFVSGTEVTLQNYQALQGMLFGIKKKWGGCCGELALPRTCWRHAHGIVCLLSGPGIWHQQEMGCALHSAAMHWCHISCIGVWKGLGGAFGQIEQRHAVLCLRRAFHLAPRMGRPCWGGAAVCWTCLRWPQSHAAGAAVLCCRDMHFSNTEKEYS